MDAARSLAPSGFASDPPVGGGRPRADDPVMEQYIEIKAANPDCLLFYRMGDFYELFFEDAEVAARALGIVLTKRGKHLGRDIPMCGVPVIRADEYLHRLIAQGHRVAVCEQMEDPALARKRGAKSVVKRDVVRLVTPGTLTEDTLLDARRNNYLLALARARVSSTDEASRFALAWIDISTGEFRIAECDRAGLAAELARLEPSEIIVSDALYSDAELAPFLRSLPAVTPLTRDVFDGATAERRLASYFSVATSDAFGALSRLELTAAAACITYVERTQLGQRPPLSPPVREAEGATLAHRPGHPQQSRTDPHARRRAARLAARRHRPHRDRGRLAAAVATAGRAADRSGGDRAAPRRGGAFRGGAGLARRDARQAERRARSCPRAVAPGRRPRRPARPRRDPRRHRGGGKPRGRARPPAAPFPLQVQAGRDRACAGPTPRSRASSRRRSTTSCRCSSATAASCGPGYDAALDEARALREGTRDGDRRAGRRATPSETGVRTLKVKHNNQLGYFVEVPSQHAEKLRQPPLNATFIHRMTMAGQVRFTTTELGELEAKIASAADRALGIELETFERLAAQVTAAAGPIKEAAEALAALDVAAALAQLAVEQDYVRPEVDGSHDFVIEGGRHPVVEQALLADGGPFVANDCDLSPLPLPASGKGAGPGRICLLTGPNMAGKSTFLRQNALIAIMAQMGSFVPARRARIGVVDRLFSRVGAADDLARGRSTFMVEMVETAAILNQAGEALARHPRRDRPRHRDLRRPLDRLGHDRAPACRQPLPRAVRHALP